MSIDTDALKASVDIVAVVSARMELKKVGKDYVGLCPFHEERTPSFNVVPDKQFCFCMACGWTGDAIKFVEEFDKVDFKEACARLGAVQAPQPIVRPLPKPARVTAPPPMGEHGPNMLHPTATWCYRTVDGMPWFYAARYNKLGPDKKPVVKENGKFEKEFRCWTWSPDDGWKCSHPSVPRPLYNLDILSQHPDSPVLLVEGEKCALSGTEMMLDKVVSTWPGGANAVGKADFSPLRGRVVHLWPDPDPAGAACLRELVEILKDIAAEVWVYNVTDQPLTWDLAEAVEQDWSYARIKEWASDIVQGQPRLSQHVYPAPPTPIIAPSVPAPAAPKVVVSQDIEDSRKRIVNKPYAHLLVKGGESGDKIIKCVKNTYIPFRHDPVWEGVIKFDEMGQSIRAVKPTPWGEQPEEWSDHHDMKAAEWLDEVGIHCTTGAVAEVINRVAHENSYHPVREYLKTVQDKWDGTPRIDTWLKNYCGVKDTKFTRFAGAKWLIAAVRRAREPGCFVKNALVLLGKQDLGKSYVLSILGGRWYGVMNMLTSDNMKAKEQTSKLWIIENAEMAATNKATQESIKEFISTKEDTYRPAYGRRVKTIPRCCVFAFTANPDEVFTDDTGNVRYWPVTVTHVDIKQLEKDRDQLWAEAATREAAGEQHWMGEGDIEIKDEARAETEQRMVSDEWHSVIQAYVDEPERRMREWFRLSEIMEKALGIEAARWNLAEQRRCGTILKRLGFAKTNREGGKAWVRVVDRPAEMFED